MENNRITILAIDDSQDNLITIKALLQEAFSEAQVHLALDGMSGIEQARKINPDLILLDVLMPGMDGFEVCKILKADPMLNDVPVVFVTALSNDKQSRIKALDAGADAFLSKPIDESELEAQVRAMVKIKQANMLKHATADRLAALVEEKTKELKANHIATLNLLEDLKTENEARRISEVALAQSELKFRTLMDNSPEGITIYVDGKIVYINKEAVRLMHANDASELLGKSIVDFIHPDNIEVVLERMKQVSQAPLNAILPSVEEKYICMDGAVIDVEIRVMPILYEGEPAIQLSGHDITEKKLAAEKLQQSELKYRLLFDRNPQPMFIYNVDTLRFIEVNAAAINHYGYSHDEFMAMSVLDIRPASDRAAFIDYIESVKTGSDTVNYEWMHLKKNGEIIYVEITATTIESDNQKNRYALINDITERKRAELQLKLSEEKYRTIIENSNDLIWMLDSNARFTFVNSQVAITTGIDSSEYIGKNFDPLVFEEDIEMLYDVFHRTLKGESCRYELRFLKPNGELLYLSVNTSPIFVEGKIEGIINFGRDITKRTIIENELKRSRLELKAIYDNAPVMMCVLNEHAEIIFANKAFEHLAQSIDADIKGNQFGNVIHCNKSFDDIRGCGYGSHCAHCSLRNAVTDTLLTGIGHSYVEHDTTMIHYGETKQISLLASTAMIYSGDTKRVLLCLHDITERKATEQILIESESRLNIMFQYSPIAIWEEDFSDVKRYIDDLKQKGIHQLDEYFQQNEDELTKVISLIKVLAINQKNNEIFATQSTDDILDNIKHYFYSNSLTARIFSDEIVALAEGKTTFEGETQIVNQAGEIKHLYMNLIVIPGFENSLSKVLVSFIDITERKLAEEALQKSEMFLRTFIENTPFEIWARDNNQVGILENKMLVDHFGSIVGKKPLDYQTIDGSIHNIWLSNNQRALLGEVVDEEVIYEYEGDKRNYQQIVFPIIIADKITGIAGFNIDITERKRAELELEQSKEQLKNFASHLQTIREEEKIALAREIHDDLGQILVALKIDMGMLNKKMNQSSPHVLPPNVLNSIEGMVELIDKTIKTTRRIMNGLRPEQLEILGFVDAVKVYVREFEERHLISCLLETNVTAVDLSHQKSLALFRIMQEALNNVVKHAKASEVVVKVQVQNDTLTLSISDNGIGFDLQKRAKNDSYGMIGMSERVILIDGKLNLKSAVGEGTTIIVEVVIGNDN